MTKSEYQELVEFLGPKFDKIDRRFDAVEERLTAVEGRLTRVEERLTAVEGRLTAVEERLTAVEVLGERDRDWTRVLADAISSLDRKVDTLLNDMNDEFRAARTEMSAGFAAVRFEMAEGFEWLGSRVTRLEGLEA